ncbi:hypothetical protein H2199_007474 [Coniosporium tulheliwenetii]|uniref:Uncharacterized protein n=1 Tax=Coniosporium tulheliwenetii TaxID=3383036 RepID=A0ACC2YPK4_9PEZI|nr:hypothetical protein H2199_007474 [Cladosporium sp. JES 115]
MCLILSAHQISNNLLATHLLVNPSSSAAIVDTTGNFSVLRLHSTLVFHLKSQRALKKSHKLANDPEPQQSIAQDAGNANHPGEEAETASPADVAEEEGNEETVAAKMLDRVKIMRVFDFVGVIEAISEIRDELEKPPAAPSDSSPMPSSPPPMPREPGMRRTVSKIGDSEDEDEEDMLFDSAAEAAEPSREPTSETIKEPAVEASSEHIPSSTSPPSGKTGMIIIDNITHVLSPLMKTDYVQATQTKAPQTHLPSSQNTGQNPTPTPRSSPQTPRAQR